MLPSFLNPLPLAALFYAEGVWMVVTAAATSCACALVGCFLVLRGASLMGDALSHAVLPGLALAFIASGRLFGVENAYHIGPLLLGAAAAGLLTTFLTETLTKYAGVPSDASMGVVFTSLFALGVVLIQKGIHGVHFDVSCVYEGRLEYTPFDLWNVLGLEMPRALVVAGGALLLNGVIVTALWKELKLSSFDPALATTMGFSAAALHYLLMAMVAVTAVASFETVGSILVVAMLIIPPATAQLLADRLAVMVWLALLMAALSAVLGYLLGVWFDTNLAGMITVAAAGLYVLAVLFSPRHGVISAIWHNASVSLRIVREDALAMLYRLEELGDRRLSAAEVRTGVGGGPLARWAVRQLVREKRVAPTPQGLVLTDAGRQDAGQLLRSHRLWEAYLMKVLGLPRDHVHEPAHRVEHYIDRQLQEQLQDELEQVGGAEQGARRE